MEKHQYNLHLEWTGDRKGTLSSPEFPSTVEVVTPPEFDKGIPGHWSPEHLYTASIVSCFMTTFLAIAEYSKFKFISFNCSAKGVLEKVEGKYLMTEVVLYPKVKVFEDSDIDKGIKLLNKSETACLISNSIVTKVILEPSVYC